MKILRLIAIFTLITLSGCTYYSVYGDTDGNIKQERKGAKTDTAADVIPGVN